MELREWKQVEIAGDSYKIQKLGAKTGRKVALRVGRILGKAAGSAVGDDVSVAGVLAEAIGAIDDETLDYFCDVFGPATKLIREDGKEPLLTDVVFDNHFSGRYAAMLEWLVVCLVENAGDFFDGSGAASLRDRLTQLLSRSQNT